MNTEDRIRDYLAKKAETLPIPEPQPLQLSPEPTNRRPALAIAGAFALALAIVGGGLLVLRATTDEVDETTATTISTTTTTVAPETTTTVIETTTVSGDAEQGYDDVRTALRDAKELWLSMQGRNWAHLVEVRCDCPQAGTTWIRHWDDWDSAPPVSVAMEGLFNTIDTAVAMGNRPITVEFSNTDGHVVSLSTTDSDIDGEYAIEYFVTGFHEIKQEPSPFDGRWTFVAGSIDGRSFASPPSYIVMSLARNRITYPIDCNQASGLVDVFGNSIGFGPIAQTLAGCGETPEEYLLFNQSMQRIETIEFEDGALVLSGPDVRLVFGSPVPTPEVIDQLPLVAAGGTLLFDPPGDETTTTYIITDRLEPFGQSVRYLVRAQAGGSEQTPSWLEWTGLPQPTEVTTGPSPHAIIIPSDLYVGDYYLCTPHWEPDPFCFELPVRPQSADKFVTAGLNGVVLFDEDGTTNELDTGVVSTAFYVAGRLVWQDVDDLDGFYVDGQVVAAEDGSVTLYDVRQFAGRTLALFSDGNTTTVIDVDSLERETISTGSEDGRITGTVAVLRTSAETVEAWNLTTSRRLWTLNVQPDTLLNVSDDGVRLDTLHTPQSDAGPETYFQFVDTTLINATTGDTIDAFTWEVAIPDEGHNIDERCWRSDFDGEHLLCATDSRIVALGANGGDSRTVADFAIMASYVRTEEAGSTTLGPPTGLAARSMDAVTFALSWDQLPGAIEYVVYMGREEVARTSSPFYETSLEVGGAYTFTVAAVDAAGLMSPRSLPVVIAPEETS